jgi:GDP-L-fucose synthase
MTIDQGRILVTGGTGMVALALKEYIPDAIYVGSSDYNLIDKNEAQDLFRETQPTHVIHLAARVGGVKGNTDYIAEFYHDNIMINTNVLEAARIHKTQKLVSLLSTCVYPAKVTYPLTEDQFHNGDPHYSNFGYAYAKRMIDIQSRAYRQQYGCNFITAIPNNLFGENDNFHLLDSHVMPAIIRKMYEAKLNGEHVVLWGDGTPLREFTYSKDIARALLLLLEGYNDPMPINIGNTQEISIRELASSIATQIGYQGEIKWDTSMPAGQYRKPSDNSRFLGQFDMQYTNTDIALRNTCKWFIMNYPNVRGVDG